jgi:general secretion pathway protein C
MGIFKNSNADRPPFEGAYVYILAALCGFFIADLGILYVRPALLPTQPPPNRPIHAPAVNYASVDQYRPITERNVFNEDAKIPPPMSANGEGPQSVDAPPVASNLPLKLEGTLVHANPAKSVATITVKSKNSADSFIVDSEIENMARVTKIERRKVIFRNLNNQRLEFIEIPADPALALKKAGPAPVDSGEVKQKNDFEFAMSRADINKYTSNLGEVLQQARMVPNIVPGSGGKVDGFRFVAIQPGSIYEKLGFKPDDIIKSVNGEPVDSPTKAMEMYNALKADNQVQLGVNRGNRDETFRYDITD